MTCSLCTQLMSPNPDEIVAEFPASVAFLGPWQYHEGYCILVSRLHVAELHHHPDRHAFVDEACRLSQAIESAFQPWKLNVESLGNVVPHLHWHIFPRRADDPDRLKAVWLGFDRAGRDAAEKARLESSPLARAEILAKIRSAL